MAMATDGNDPARIVADQLNAGGPKTRTAGANYMAVCPAHTDVGPSLAIRWNGQKLLFRCHAGCGFREIAKALRHRGIDPGDGSPLGAPGRRKIVAQAVPEKKEDPGRHVPWDGWMEEAARIVAVKSPNAIRTHVYRDYDGTPLMRVDTTLVTRPGKKPDKIFQPRTPFIMPDGSKVIKDEASPTAESPRPPYNAEKLEGTSGPVLYVEGEKCADALHDYIKGALPVLALYGNNPDGTDFSRIAGRPLVAFKDLDASGDGHAWKVARRHEGPTGIATAPWIADGKPPEGWDIADAITGNEHMLPLRFKQLLEGMRDSAKAQEETGLLLGACAADPALAMLVTDAAVYGRIAPNAPESIAIANVDRLDAGDDGADKALSALPRQTRIVIAHGDSRSQLSIANKLAARRMTAVAVMLDQEGVTDWEGAVKAILAEADACADGAAATRAAMRALRASNPGMRDD